MALILHIGTHKTATTLLQRFAHRHRDRLREAGLEYPAWEDWLGIRGHYAHHDLAHAIGDNSNRIDRRHLNRFWDAMREHARDHNVLISAEPMYRYQLRNHGGAKTARHAYVQRIGEWVQDIDVEVLLVCRRPDDFAASMYGEHVLQTAFTGTLSDFVQQKAYLFDYAWQIGIWEANVGRVRHLCYESLKQQDIVNAFFAELGVDVRTWDRPDVANKSRDPAFVELKRRANEFSGSSGANKGYLGRLNRMRINDVLENETATRPRSLWPSHDVECAFLNSSLEKFAGSHYWDEDKYGVWRTPPIDKTYMSEWLADMKLGETSGA